MSPRPISRVLVVAYLFPPVGGAGVQRIAKFVKYLPDFGWHPTVLTAANPSVPLLDSSLLADVPSQVPVVRARTLEPDYALKKTVSGCDDPAGPTGSGIVSFLKRLARRWANAVLQPDPQILWYPAAVRWGTKVLRATHHEAILVTAPPFSSFLVGATLSRRTGLPLLLDYRDEWDISNRYWENKQHGMISRLLQSAMQRSVVRQARALIATTRASAESLQHIARQAGSAARSVCIYNGYDAEDFRSFSSRTDRPSDGRYRLAYVGTLWNLTSVEPLVKAVMLLCEQNPELARQLELVFAGRRTASQDALLQKLAGLPCRVERHPYLSHDAALDLMRSADGLCLLLSDVPHADRVVPGKVFEYLATGRPILFIGPRGEVARILEPCPHAFVCEATDMAGIRNVLREQLQHHVRSADRITTPRDASDSKRDGSSWSPSQYERRQLTAQLAELLDQITRQSHQRQARQRAPQAGELSSGESLSGKKASPCELVGAEH
ncbi:MAG: glycosyltransferase family 4 protein [Planctomycetes bacterium]|nr:glycosyltransferase family 4 protein [Planctomycetota bacterium]